MTIVGSARLARILPIMATRVSSPVVVGRDAELHTIESALDRAAGGETVHLLVAGEAGVGKTRLTSEAARLAGDRGFRVLRGDCGNVGGSSLPYGPFVEALRNLAIELGPAETAAVAGPAARDLARLVPAFGSLDEAPSQSDWVQARLFEALFGLFQRLAERSPVLLIVEDLHWADAATRETIAYLVRALRDVPSCSSARSAATSSIVAMRCCRGSPSWIAAAAWSGSISPASTAPRWRRCSRRSSARSRTPQLVADVFSRSDGNPFFAEELLAASRQGRAGPRLPPTLREILLAHVAAVPETATAVLRVAAVAGRRVEHELLAEVAGLPEDELLDGLRAAVGGHLLVVEIRRRRGTLCVPPRARPGGRVRRTAARRAAHPASGLRRGARGANARRAAPPRRAAGPSWRTTGPPPGRTTVRSHASLRAADAAMGSYAFGAALHRVRTCARAVGRRRRPRGVSRFDRVELLRKAGHGRVPGGRLPARRRTPQGGRPWRRPRPPTRSGRGSCARSSGAACGSSATAAGALEAYREAVAITPGRPADRGAGAGPVRAGPDPDAARSLRGIGGPVPGGDRGRPAGRRAGPGRSRPELLRARPHAARHVRRRHGRDPRSARDRARDPDLGRHRPRLREPGRVALRLRRRPARRSKSRPMGIRDERRARDGHVLTVTTSGSTERSARTRSGAGTSPARGRRRPSPGCRPAGVRSSTASPTRWSCTSRKAASTSSTQGSPGRSSCWTRHSGAQFIGPIHAAAAERELWRHRPLEALDAGRTRTSTGWPPPRTGCRRCGSVASARGQPRTWAKPRVRRATAATAAVARAERRAASLRGSTSSSRAYAGAAGWARAGRQSA